MKLDSNDRHWCLQSATYRLAYATNETPKNTIAVSVHAYFFLQGDDAFRLPVSLGLLVTTFLLSLAQAIALFKLRSTLKLTESSQLNQVSGRDAR